MSVVLAACSGASASDAGTDAGSDGGADAGPVCTGVPARLTQYTCVEATFPFPITCEATFEATLAQQTANCDAGPGIQGYVAEGDCVDLRSVSWVYGFPGDTYECFYARDGGAWTGGINFSDRGTFIGGHVGDCAPKPTAACRDGG
jgi:hypothetical protein